MEKIKFIWCFYRKDLLFAQLCERNFEVGLLAMSVPSKLL